MRPTSRSLHLGKPSMYPTSRSMHMGKPRLTDAALPFVPSLTLNFANAASIEAGKPYLVKVAANTDLSTAPFTEAIVSKDGFIRENLCKKRKECREIVVPLQL